MAFTQTDVDALKTAIASGKGAQTIEFGDQKVTFRDVDEMRALLALMMGEVSTAAGTPRTRYAATSKGV